jgi:hypothetical protein
MLCQHRGQHEQDEDDEQHGGVLIEKASVGVDGVGHALVIGELALIGADEAASVVGGDAAAAHHAGWWAALLGLDAALVCLTGETGVRGHGHVGVTALTHLVQHGGLLRR